MTVNSPDLLRQALDHPAEHSSVPGIVLPASEHLKGATDQGRTEPKQKRQCFTMAEQIGKKTSLPKASRGATPRHYVMEDQVGFLMRVAMQRHTSIFMSLMVHDLTQPQFAALAKLVEVGTCSQNHLGRLVYLDAATIKGVVDRLRMRKLVTVQFNPKDRRRSMVAVTKNGYRIANEAIQHAHRITRKTLAPLKPLEQRQIVRLLRKMI